MAEIVKTDLCVVGGGAAALAAAREGRAMGASVILVAPEISGTAFDHSRLAAHALAASARRAHQMRTARALGIGGETPRVNFGRVNAHINAVLDAAVAEDSDAVLTAGGITVISDAGEFIDKRTLKAGGTHIRARRFIVASGTRPAIPDIPGLGSVPFHTPETITGITRRPGHLIVLGGGETGLALAQAHLRLGSEVTLIDIVDPLSDCDAELRDIVLRRLGAEGLTVLANTGVVSVRGGDEEITVATKTGAAENEIAGTHLLVATGRRPSADGLGLDKAGIVAAGPIARDRVGRTANRRIYALGAGAHSVHALRSEARRAVARALGRIVGPPDPAVPRVVYTDPEIARVGMTEAMARERYKARFTLTRFPFASIDRARALGETEGHIKLITHENGRILGAAIVGPQAGELITLFALAIARKVTPYELERLVAPHPALCEIVTALAAAYAETYPRAGLGQQLGRALGIAR